MSTRATYEFRDRYGRGGTIYIHTDGYPAGAAHHLARAIVYGGERGSMAERMIRGNPDTADLTDSHEGHGDTEYRYTIHRPTADNGSPLSNAPDVISVDQRVEWDGPEALQWQRVETVPLAVFLTRYAKDAPDWSELSKGHEWTHLAGRCVTVAWLTQQARERLNYAWHALDKGGTGNASSAAADAARMVGAGAAISRGELLACLRATCETCPHMVEYHLREAGLDVPPAIEADAGNGAEA